MNQNNTKKSNSVTNINGKRSLDIDDNSNNGRKRRKLNNIELTKNIEEKKDERNDIYIDYNGETTVELAKRLQAPSYAHKIIYHHVKWAQYLDKDTTKDIEVNAVEPRKDAFILNNVLSEKECKILIHLSEKHGYCPIYSALIGKTNRTNTRVIVDDKSLSMLLYQRIKCYLPSIYKINGQIWKICGLNQRFRFCRYSQGQQFKIHHDGRNGIKGENIASFYTINIYLNDGIKDFKNGKTIFYEYNTGYNRRNKYDANNLKYIESSRVTPKPGMFLVFNHYPNHYKHSGEIVKNGLKYIFRTEAMYKLMSGPNNWRHKRSHKEFN